MQYNRALSPPNASRRDDRVARGLVPTTVPAPTDYALDRVLCCFRSTRVAVSALELTGASSRPGPSPPRRHHCRCRPAFSRPSTSRVQGLGFEM